MFEKKVVRCLESLKTLGERMKLIKIDSIGRQCNMNSSVFDHLHIVLGGEHYNPLGIIRSLGEAGISPIAIITKGNKKFVGSSKYVSKAIRVNDVDEAIHVLLEKFGKLDKKPFLYVTDDYFLEYIDTNYLELKEHFYVTNAGENGRISYYMNKDNLNKLATECGMIIPQSEVVRKGLLPKSLKYPIITKAISSTSGAWKADSFICSSENELKEAYARIKGETILLQEYIERDSEFNIDGVSVDHGNSVFLSMMTDFVYLVPGRYSHYHNVSNPKDENLNEKLKEIIKRVGYEGIFDGEFMRGKDGKTYFLEVNFRPNAFNYASTCAGMNDPYIWAKGMLDGYISEDNYREIPKGFHSMVENMDFKDRIQTHYSSIIRWFFDFVKCDCHFFFNKRDMKPFIYAFILRRH